MKIHLIEPLNNFTKLRDNVWENGCWKMKESMAEKLVGGEIYFHKKREEPSFYGGKILGCRIATEGPDQGKVIFEFQYSLSCRNIRTDRAGWSMRMKIIESGGEEEPPAKTTGKKQKKLAS